MTSFRFFDDDARRGHEAAVVLGCLQHLLLFSGLVPCSFAQLAEATGTAKIDEVCSIVCFGWCLFLFRR